MKKMWFDIQEKDGSFKKIEIVFKDACLFGWAGRDQEEVKKHAIELAEHGIRGPKNMPEVFLISPTMMGQQERLTYIGNDTCGEIEFFFFEYDKQILVGTGSEHTDRALESVDMIKSKAICEKVMSKVVWRYNDIHDHWDDLVLTAWQSSHNKDALYQNSQINALLSLDFLHKQAEAIYGNLDGVIVWSGTIPTVNGLVYGEKFWGEMVDPVLNRKIEFSYNINTLPADE